MIQKENDCYFLRLDKNDTLGIYGDKARLAYELCKDQEGIVTCGSRESIQTCVFAEICDKLNIPCVIVIPNGKDTDSIKRIKNTNAEIVRAKVGYNTVLNATARKEAENRNYKFIQLGMLCDEAYDLISENAKYIKECEHEIDKIVCPVGSGTTLIGLVKGLRKYNIDIKVVGVMCGMNAVKNIIKGLDGDMSNIELYNSELDYHEHASNVICNIELNPTYEAKCIPYLEKNSLLYIVSR